MAGQYVGGSLQRATDKMSVLLAERHHTSHLVVSAFSGRHTALQCAIKHDCLHSTVTLTQALSDQHSTRISSFLRCTQNSKQFVIGVEKRLGRIWKTQTDDRAWSNHRSASDSVSVEWIPPRTQQSRTHGADSGLCRAERDNRCWLDCRQTGLSVGVYWRRLSETTRENVPRSR